MKAGLNAKINAMLWDIPETRRTEITQKILQNKVLKIVAKLPVEFYLTGGTALSRVYLNHRYSDDLDFFLNNSSSFKSQAKHPLRRFGKRPLGKSNQCG